MNLTLEEIENWEMSVSETLEKIQTYAPPYPQRPNKPLLAANATPNQIFEYGEKVQKWIELTDEHLENKKLYDEICGNLNSLKEEFIKNYTDFYKVVPQSKQSKVWNKALNDGNGWYEIFWKLEELVELFED